MALYNHIPTICVFLPFYISPLWMMAYQPLILSLCCSRNATYESLLGTRQPFPKSVPLSVSISGILILVPS